MLEASQSLHGVSLAQIVYPSQSQARILHGNKFSLMLQYGNMRAVGSCWAGSQKVLFLFPCECHRPESLSFLELSILNAVECVPL